MTFTIEVEQENDGRWIAEIPQIPGAMVYGRTREEAVSRVEAMALRVLAKRIEHGEMSPVIEKVFPVSSRISEIQNTMRSREPIIGLALLQHLCQPPTCGFSAGAV